MCVLSGDKAITCTCGHTVERGWVYEETITVMYHGKPKTVIYTYCDRDGCDAKAMRYELDSYVDVEQTIIKSGSDYLGEKADAEYDERI